MTSQTLHFPYRATGPPWHCGLMRVRYFRRFGVLRLLKIAAVATAIWTTLEVLAVHRALTITAAQEPPPFGNQKIFIASIHWTDEAVLRSHWIPAIVELATEIGLQNVFLSIEESGSLDDTKGALMFLDDELAAAGVRRNITLDPTTRMDVVEQSPAESGWVVMPFDKKVRETHTTWTTIPKGKDVPRRIPHLAALRNSVLKPLYELDQAGERFDKILFLNDIVFKVSLLLL